MIVIPMAGMSSRFFKSGYKSPKYMLEAHGKTLFEHSVSSFKKYFKAEKFLFIVRDIYETPKFVEEESEMLGISDFEIVVLDRETRGQAETVTLGLEAASDYDGQITIFNIDTFRPRFEFPPFVEECDSYLEVFKGEGDNWSFAKPLNDKSTLVVKTAEKNPISDLCSTGLYHFRSKNEYLKAYYAYLSKPESEWEKGELYIAPIYNIIIDNNIPVHYNLISNDEVIFCGTPDEFVGFLKRKVVNLNHEVS